MGRGRSEAGTWQVVCPSIKNFPAFLPCQRDVWTAAMVLSAAPYSLRSSTGSQSEGASIALRQKAIRSTKKNEGIQSDRDRGDVFLRAFQA